MLILIALAIASGVEGSNYSSPSSVALGVKLAKAYGVICLVLAGTWLMKRYFPVDYQCDSMGFFVD
jgi:hypothetical protein